MLSRLLSFGLLTTLLVTMSPVAFAQSNEQQSCTTQVFDTFAHEQRLYRSVLFGQKKSKDLPVGSVRYDKQGNSWIKKTNNLWRTLADSRKNDLLDDNEMDSEADVPVRRGLFETRQALTSELIPSLTQSFRAFDCRLRAVCETESASQQTNDDTVQVQPVGCIQFTENALPACRGNVQGTVSVDGCDQSVDAILNHERALLTLTVAYDSAYRTLLQFEGSFQGFLTDFQFPLLYPLWQTVRAIGGLGNLSCFIGQCDQ